MELELKKEWRANLPNCITLLRIAGTLCLLFTRPGSLAFYAVYTLAGLTDALDGWLGRRLGVSSDFGARLDSIADLLFYGVMLLRLCPLLWLLLPVQIWYAVGAAFLIRLTSYLLAAVKYRRFASLHTYLNKLTGGAVFLLPYLLTSPSMEAYCWTVCAAALTASLEELMIHLQQPVYRPDIKSIFEREG